MDRQPPLGLAERRARLEAAEEALDGLDVALYQASGAELGAWMSLADRVAAKAAAARVAVTVEATPRGEVGALDEQRRAEYQLTEAAQAAGAWDDVARQGVTMDGAIRDGEQDEDLEPDEVWLERIAALDRAS